MGKKSKTRQEKQHGTLEDVSVASDHSDGDCKFARALGSGDFHTRDQGLNALMQFLSAQDSIDEVSLKKLWKGIMYCFWHSDKFPVQKDLAQRLSGIIQLVKAKVAHQYFTCFLDTMLREWKGIDKLRLDKYMMLVRCFFHEVFASMAAHSWDKSVVVQYTATIHGHAFHADDSTQSIGFCLHVADVYIGELMRVAETSPDVQLPNVICIKLLRPFISVLQATHQPALLERIRNSVFGAFLAILQHQQEGSPSPWALCKPAKVAAALEAAGEAAEVRARNRGVLYDLSGEFARLAPRKRSREDNGADAQPAKQAKLVAANGRQSGANGPAQRQANGNAAATAPLQDANGARPVQTEKSAVVGGVVLPIPSTDAPVAAADSSAKAARKVAKKAAKRAAKTAAGEQSARVLRSSDGQLSPTSGAALANAVQRVEAEQRTPEKRRITFDLGKNLVHQIGKPLPPAGMSTPPSAKPRGSVLKKVTKVFPPIQDVPAHRRRKSFGGLGSDLLADAAKPFLTP